MSPLVNFEYIPTRERQRYRRNAQMMSNSKRRRVELRQSLKACMSRVDTYRRGGLGLVAAVKLAGLPQGAWTVLGATRQQAAFVVWRRRGIATTGEPYSDCLAHRTYDYRHTLCGKPIPTTRTHHIKFTDGEKERWCATCAAVRRHRKETP